MKQKSSKEQGSNDKVDKKMVPKKAIGPIANLEQHFWGRLQNQGISS